MENMKVGNYIKELLKINNMTNRDFIDELQKSHISMSEANVSKFLNGKQGTDIENYMVIAKIFGITIDDLLQTNKSLLSKILRTRSKILFFSCGILIGVILSSIVFFSFPLTLKNTPNLESNSSLTTHTTTCMFQDDEGWLVASIECDEFEFIIDYQDDNVYFYLNNSENLEVTQVNFYYGRQKQAVEQSSTVEYRLDNKNHYWQVLYLDARFTIKYLK